MKEEALFSKKKEENGGRGTSDRCSHRGCLEGTVREGKSRKETGLFVCYFSQVSSLIFFGGLFRNYENIRVFEFDLMLALFLGMNN